MRRALPRTFVPLVLVAALAVGMAPAASAHAARSQSLAARVQSRLTALLHGSARPLDHDVSVSVGFAGGPTLFGSFHVPGSPYHWGVGMARTRGGFVVFVDGARNIGFGEGYELHEWAFAVPRGDGAIGPGLHHGHIHTGTALGAFGKIDLTFGSARRVKHQSFRCASGQPPVTTGYTRRGTLRGSLNLTPNVGSLPDLHATHMRGAMERSVRSSTSRARSREATASRAAIRRRRFSVADKAQHAEADFYGPNQMDVSTFTTAKGSFEGHELSISGLRRIVHQTPSGLTVDGSGMAPYFSGNLAFETASAASHRGALCQITHTHEAWTAGTLTANLDSGVINLTGSAARGSIVTYKRP